MQDSLALAGMLGNWLQASLQGKFLEKFEWLQEKVESGLSDRAVYMHFGALPRYVGKTPLNSGAEEGHFFPNGLNANHWSVDQAARIWLLLHLDRGDAASFFTKIEKVFLTADMGELVALYQGLSLYPEPERFAKRAAEGIRTNMVDVFDAVALDNPYPAGHLPNGAWNQLVLKAAFMSRPLYRIYGLERRGNTDLTRIVVDYAHERWAASRIVAADIWNAAEPFGSEVPESDLQKLLHDTDPLQQKAGALLRNQPEQELSERIKAWQQLGREWHDRNQ